MKVFVYGTLKSGYGNNYILRNSEKVCDAIVSGYKLYNSGFPVAASCHQSSVSGEVWDIGDPVFSETSRRTIERLDGLESVPWLYTRENVSAVDSVGNRHDVSMYVGNPETFRMFHGMEKEPDNEGVYYWQR